MECRHCGAKIKKEDEFCPECGKKMLSRIENKSNNRNKTIFFKHETSTSPIYTISIENKDSELYRSIKSINKFSFVMALFIASLIMIILIITKALAFTIISMWNIDYKVNPHTIAEYIIDCIVLIFIITPGAIPLLLYKKMPGFSKVTLVDTNNNIKAITTSDLFGHSIKITVVERENAIIKIDRNIKLINLPTNQFKIKYFPQKGKNTKDYLIIADRNNKIIAQMQYQNFRMKDFRIDADDSIDDLYLITIGSAMGYPIFSNTTYDLDYDDYFLLEKKQKKCPNCGHKTNATDEKCPNCGHELYYLFDNPIKTYNFARLNIYDEKFTITSEQSTEGTYTSIRTTNYIRIVYLFISGFLLLVLETSLIGLAVILIYYLQMHLNNYSATLIEFIFTILSVILLIILFIILLISIKKAFKVYNFILEYNRRIPSDKKNAGNIKNLTKIFFIKNSFGLKVSKIIPSLDNRSYKVKSVEIDSFEIILGKRTKKVIFPTTELGIKNLSLQKTTGVYTEIIDEFSKKFICKMIFADNQIINFRIEANSDFNEVYICAIGAVLTSHFIQNPIKIPRNSTGSMNSI